MAKNIILLAVCSLLLANRLGDTAERAGAGGQGYQIIRDFRIWISDGEDRE